MLTTRRPSISFSKTIEVLVGKAQVKFTIHPDLICARSPFFDAAMKRWYTEGEPVTLKHDEPDLFNYYLQSVYADEAAPLAGGTYDTEEEMKRAEEKEVKGLLKLYIFADRISDLTCANAAIDRLMKLTMGYRGVRIAVEDLLEVWRLTPPTSPLS